MTTNKCFGRWALVLTSLFNIAIISILQNGAIITYAKPGNLYNHLGEIAKKISQLSFIKIAPSFGAGLSFYITPKK